MRVAVVGHVELVRFARVAAVPRAGEIVHASASWDEVAGGGGVAAAVLARLAGGCLFLTALGDDDGARFAAERLDGLGVDVRAAVRAEQQRRAFTMTDDGGERTIVVLGDRMVPLGADELPWDELASVDAVYFTGGDVAALRAARAARVLVASARTADVLMAAGVRLDALVGSAGDPGERVPPLDPPPLLTVQTEGARGGRWVAADGREGRWEAAPLPGPIEDAYGAGDSFAATLTHALGAGQAPQDAVVPAARAGAAALTVRGPFPS